MNKKLFITISVIVVILLGTGVYLSMQSEPTLSTPQPLATSTPSTPATPANTIEVTIISSPQTANIYVNEQNVGQTPLQYKFARNQTYELKALKPGYIPQVLSYTPQETTLRLQLVPESITVSPTPAISISNTSVQTFSPIPTPTTSSQPQGSATAVPFPVAPNLRVLNQSTTSFVYTPKPTPTASPAASPSSSSPTPTITNSASPITSSSAKPSAEQVVAYTDLIAEYKGVHNFDADDPVQEGTSDETGVVVSTQWLYINRPVALAGFPIRFINDGATQCDLRAQTRQGELEIGKLIRNDSVLFTAQAGTEETIRFWCQERPTVSVSINILP